MDVPTYRWTDGNTNSQVTTRIFEIDRLPNFLRYGALLCSACTPLLHRSSAIGFHIKLSLFAVVFNTLALHL